MHAPPITVTVGTALVGGAHAREVELLADLYLPDGDGPHPFMVLIHGGGFFQYDRTHDGIVRTARSLVDHEIAAVSIDYRLRDDQPVVGERFRAVLDAQPTTPAAPSEPLALLIVTALEDAVRAVEYCCANGSRHRLDSARFAVGGSSAGALTANHLAYTWPTYDSSTPVPLAVASLWGGLLLRPRDGDEPVDAINHRGPPLFVTHGDDDTLVSVAYSDALVARAARVGLAHEYLRIPGGNHGYGPARYFEPLGTQPSPHEQMVRFVAAQLR